MICRKPLFLSCVAAACSVSFTVAAEPAAPDVDLPEPFDPSVAINLVEHPPFTRALNLSESLLLTGVAYVDGKPVATVKDVTTNKSHVVSEEPNAMGWRLAAASPSAELMRAEVQIIVGTELIPVRYSEMQMMPQKRSSGSGFGGLRSYDRSRPPTEQEFTGKDDKGAYVRATPYLSDADRDKMRNMSGDTRQRFLNVIHDNRERMFRYSHEERANFVKKVFDSVGR